MPTIAKLLGIVLALFTAYGTYWFYQDRRAQTAAEEFCNAIPIGSRASEVVERAKAAARRTADSSEHLVVFFQGPVFNAYICDVTLVNGTVSRKQVSRMED